MSTGETYSNESTKKLDRGSAGQKVDAIAAYLKRKHPELFQASPRAGGFHLSTSPFTEDNKTTAESEEDASLPKVKSVFRPLATSTPRTSSANIKEMLVSNRKCPRMHEMATSGNDRDNMVRIISIVVSTVMMLARHNYENITVQHLNHAEEYFRSLKEEDGYPQNIRQLLQVLSNLKKSGKIPMHSEGEEQDNIEDEMSF